MRDLKGYARYLAQLLIHPGREFHVLDLVGAERGSLWHPRTPARSSTSGPRPRIAAASQRSRTTSSRRTASRTTCGRRRPTPSGTSWFESLRGRWAWVVVIGRPHRPSQRARSGVTRAVRQAIARIGEHHPPLGEHLNRAVHTGTTAPAFPVPRRSCGLEVEQRALSVPCSKLRQPSTQFLLFALEHR